MRNLILTIFVAFLISLAIHFLFYSFFKDSFKHNQLKINTTNKIVKNKKQGLTTIKYVKIKKIQKKKKRKAVPKKIAKPKKKILKPKYKKVQKPKPTTKREVSKKSIKKTKPIKKKKTIQNSKTEPQIDLKKLFTIQKSQQTQTPMELLRQQEELEQQKEIQEIEQLDQLTQSYIKLYGQKYFTFSKEQKRYLKDNLNTIGRITQSYLRYPQVAIRTRQSGLNVIEFFLHPNGDITDLKITDSSYYTALDQNTIDTIKIAYKDYPKPTQTVKIKIYVKYILN